MLRIVLLAMAVMAPILTFDPLSLVETANAEERNCNFWDSGRKPGASNVDEQVFFSVCQLNSVWEDETKSTIRSTVGDGAIGDIGAIRFVFDDAFCNQNVELKPVGTDGQRKVVFGRGFAVLNLFGMQPYFFYLTGNNEIGDPEAIGNLLFGAFGREQTRLAVQCVDFLAGVNKQYDWKIYNPAHELLGKDDLAYRSLNRSLQDDPVSRNLADSLAGGALMFVALHEIGHAATGTQHSEDAGKESEADMFAVQVMHGGALPATLGVFAMNTFEILKAGTGYNVRQQACRSIALIESDQANSKANGKLFTDEVGERLDALRTAWLAYFQPKCTA